MARGLNKVMLIGRIGRDPKIQYTQGGTAIANFSIATNEEWTDKKTGEKTEKTEWHRIVAFGKLGEICSEYLSKGRQVYVEGRIQTRSWEHEGIKRNTTEIVANNMQMLDSNFSSNKRHELSEGQENVNTEKASDESESEAESSEFDDEIAF
jgi:single-strand DNA-binding protein